MLESSLYDCDCFVGNAKFDFSSTVVLANIYYDFNRGGRFVPYIGAGIGFAHNETSSGTVETPCGCDATIDKGSSNQFAAAAMAGVSWRIRGGETTYVGGLKDEPVAVSNGHALYLDVGYRFLYLGDVKTGDITWNPRRSCRSGNQEYYGSPDPRRPSVRPELGERAFGRFGTRETIEGRGATIAPALASKCQRCGLCHGASRSMSRLL